MTATTDLTSTDRASTDLTSSGPAPSDRAAAPPAGTVELLAGGGWFAVCPVDVLEPGRGVAVLLPDGGQAALFRDRAGRLYAIGNVDPFTGAGVLSHGLVGSAPDRRPYVASPLLKQRFDLADGRCLDDGRVAVASYPVRVS